MHRPHAACLHRGEFHPEVNIISLTFITTPRTYGHQWRSAIGIQLISWTMNKILGLVCFLNVGASELSRQVKRQPVLSSRSKTIKRSDYAISAGEQFPFKSMVLRIRPTLQFLLTKWSDRQMQFYSHWLCSPRTQSSEILRARFLRALGT